MLHECDQVFTVLHLVDFRLEILGRNQATSLRLNVMEEGVVESATTISLPSTRPRSARVSFKFFLVAASILGTDCM